MIFLLITIKYYDIINYCINQIENLDERSKDDTQDNFDKVYAEFEALLLADTKPVIEKGSAEKNEGEKS